MFILLFILILRKWKLINFFLLWIMFFCVIAKKNLCPTQYHKDLLLFFSRHFMVLSFTFRSMIHSDGCDYFCIRYEVWVKAQDFAYGCLTVPESFVLKILSLSALNCHYIFAKNQLTIYVWVYFRTLFFPLIYLSILLPIHVYFDYCK